MHKIKEYPEVYISRITPETHFVITNNFIYSLCLASLKSFGDKATNLFERKKKEAGDVAAEKVDKAKKLAEDQVTVSMYIFNFIIRKLIDS
jgi:hypothetical protein